ncbi:MAG: hypothetical protein R3C26_25520 [Calditrichia bacterium]
MPEPPTQVEILPDSGYGIAWIGGASEAWFDRIGGSPTEPDIDVNPTAMTVNENSPSAQQSPQNITFSLHRQSICSDRNSPTHRWNRANKPCSPHLWTSRQPQT